MSERADGRGRAVRLAVTPARFVVGWHEMPPGSATASHLDLMIEMPGSDRLATWRIEGWDSMHTAKETDLRNHSVPLLDETDRDPSPCALVTTSATRIVDHAVEWLEREGPVSGGRGQFIRVVTGWGVIHHGGDETLIQRGFTLVVRTIKRFKGKQNSSALVAAPEWVDRLVAIDTACDDRDATRDDQDSMRGSWTTLWIYQVAE